MAIAPEHLARAVDLFRGGQLDEAHALAPRHEIENALGTDCAKRGDLDGAERHYREAIARSPGFFKPHNNLGNVLVARGQLAAAADQYRAALAIEPSAQRVHANLGNTLLELGLPLDAAESYRKALALGPTPQVALRLAEALEAMGDTDLALPAYVHAAELGDPTATTKREDLLRAIEVHGPFGRPPPPETTRATPLGLIPDKLGRRPIVASAGDELRALLAPVTPETFVGELWARRPLFVKGFADKYRGLFDWQEFLEAVKNPGNAPATHLRGSFDKRVAVAPRGGPPLPATQIFTVTPGQSGQLFEAGATICMTEVESRVPRLAAFLAAIKRQIGFPGQIAFNAYASRDGVGFNWHFDGRVASTLQIEGSKRWRFSRKVALDWPRGNGTRRTDGSAAYADPTLTRGAWETLAPLDPSDVTSVVLEPGDLLILPAGLWHDAEGGPTGSLAINMAFLPLSHTRLVAELLDRKLEHDAAWRGAAPMLPAREGAPPDDARVAAFRAELERAAETLRAIAADPVALPSVWASLVEELSPPPAGFGHA
jgi:tetratricopeptide (TPR) repeat protein